MLGHEEGTGMHRLGRGVVMVVTWALAAVVVGAVAASAEVTDALGREVERGAAEGEPDCTGDPGDPDPDTDRAAWVARDLENLLCATQRQQDNLTNPAFLRTWATETGSSLGDLPSRALRQLEEPHRPRLNPIHWMPPATVTDPFRDPDRWEAAGRGQVLDVRFVASTGAHLQGRLYAPHPDRRGARLPGVVFSPGLQSYNEVNSWLAQGLAEAGYLVLIYDPQGQGSSESLPHSEDGRIACGTDGCENWPTDAVAELESAIDFLLSAPEEPHPHATGDNAHGTMTHNPLWARLDGRRIGIGGHSLGAIAAGPIAQRDERVSAAVLYDDLGQRLPEDVARDADTPVLGFHADYDFPAQLTPKDPDDPPDPDRWAAEAYGQLVEAGVDAMTVTTRASTHYEWGYQPFPASFPASRLGERVSFHYTLAWFDRYLAGDRRATNRLTALTFDDSADAHSIGAGTYDASRAAARPFDPRAGNVPYEIDGHCVADLLSFYYRSAYHLENGRLVSDELRARGCE